MPRTGRASIMRYAQLDVKNSAIAMWVPRLKEAKDLPFRRTIGVRRTFVKARAIANRLVPARRRRVSRRRWTAGDRW
jgi:hypothetical protein